MTNLTLLEFWTDWIIISWLIVTTSSQFQCVHYIHFTCISLVSLNPDLMKCKCYLALNLQFVQLACKTIAITLYSLSSRTVGSDATMCYCTRDSHKCTERKINKILRMVTEIAEVLKEQKNAAPSLETPCIAEEYVMTAATTPEELDALATLQNLVSSWNFLIS